MDFYVNKIAIKSTFKIKLKGLNWKILKYLV